MMKNEVDNKSFFHEVGKNILVELKKQGLTQQYLAEQIGVSKQVMNKIISGLKAINVEEISHIAAVLHISADKLLQIQDANSATHNFSFMGEVTKESTKQKIKLLQNVIDEIIFLEDLDDEKSNTATL